MNFHGRRWKVVGGRQNGPKWTPLDDEMDVYGRIRGRVRGRQNGQPNGRPWTNLDDHGHVRKRSWTCPWTTMDLNGPSISPSKKKSNNVQDPGFGAIPWPGLGAWAPVRTYTNVVLGALGFHSPVG